MYKALRCNLKRNPLHNIFCRIRTHTHLVKHRAVFVKSEVSAKQAVRSRRKMTSTFFFRRVVANSQQMPHFWRVFTILLQKYKIERKILHKNRKYATQQQKVVTKQKKCPVHIKIATNLEFATK